MTCKYCNEPGASICNECQEALTLQTNMPATLLDNPLYNLVECKQCGMSATPQSYNDNDDSGICIKCQPQTSKKCHKCNAIKPKESFGKNKSRPDGLAAYCKVCEKQRFKERRV